MALTFVWARRASCRAIPDRPFSWRGRSVKVPNGLVAGDLLGCDESATLTVHFLPWRDSARTAGALRLGRLDVPCRGRMRMAREGRYGVAKSARSALLPV